MLSRKQTIPLCAWLLLLRPSLPRQQLYCGSRFLTVKAKRNGHLLNYYSKPKEAINFSFISTYSTYADIWCLNLLILKYFNWISNSQKCNEFPKLMLLLFWGKPVPNDNELICPVNIKSHYQMVALAVYSFALRMDDSLSLRCPNDEKWRF